MKILALESSGDVSGVALLEDDKVLAEYSLMLPMMHNKSLAAICGDVLRMLDMDISEIELFACSIGPGSFTGVRIASALVQGLSSSADKPAIGVSSLWSLAENLAGLAGYICPVTDARRGEVYSALFHSEKGRISEDRLIGIADLSAELKSLGEPVYLVGDAADLIIAGESENKFIRAPKSLNYPSAASVGRLALRQKDMAGLASLMPEYLKLSQAESERKLRIEGEK